MTTGNGFTVIILVDVFVQPCAFVPVTVYVVVEVGETVTEPPVKFPGIQVYVAAPLAVIVVLAPIQIDVAVAVVVTTGDGLTVTVAVAVLLQVVVASVPVTV